MRSVRGNVVNKLFSASKLASLATPESVSEEILLFLMVRLRNSGKVARVRDESKLFSAVSVSNLGKPDKVRLVSRFEETLREERSG